jgi:serine/threonine-protein kinase HipA
LLTNINNEVLFSPAYDLLCTKMALPDDKEEMALTLNGRKRKLKREDFDVFGNKLAISSKSMQNIFIRFSERLHLVDEWIDISFLPVGMKKEYKEIIHERAKRIGIE